MRLGRKLAVSDRPRQKGVTDRDDSEPRVAKKPSKLSYKDQRELDSLPQRISQFEERIEALQVQTADPGFYEQDFEQTVQPVLDDLARSEATYESLLTRWTELEDLAASLRQK